MTKKRKRGFLETPNKKNENADFKKKKQKVGKKTPPTTSHTETSFKSKSISLPKPILAEKDDVVNEKNLTLRELLNQLKHYNENMRKSAILGLEDLFLKHSNVLTLHLGTIFESLVELLTDPEKNVRQVLYHLFEQIFSQLDEISIKPFLPLFVAYIGSGITHLIPPVRIDTLKFVNMLISKLHSHLSTYSKELLPNLIGLLSDKGNVVQGISVSTKKVMPLETRYLILESLHHCLQISQPETIKEFANTFFPTLIENWIECSPIDQLLSANATELKCMDMILKMILLFFSKMEEKFLADSISKEEKLAFYTFYFAKLFKYIFVHFPFEIYKRDPKQDEYLFGYNVAIASISVYFFENFEEESNWKSTLLDYIITCINEQTKGVNTAVFLPLLPVMKSLYFYLPSEEEKTQILQCFGTFEKQFRVNSPSKKHCITFILDLFDNIQALPRQIVEQWSILLTKYLWQIQNKDLAMSKIILKKLLHLTNNSSFSVHLSNVQTSLIPFFFTSIKTKEEEKQIFGPFLKLPFDIQKIALELIFKLGKLLPKMQIAFVSCSPFMDSWILTYLIELLGYYKQELSVSEFLSFILSVLVANIPSFFSQNNKLLEPNELPRFHSMIDVICNQIYSINHIFYLLEPLLFSIATKGSLETKHGILLFLLQLNTKNSSLNSSPTLFELCIQSLIQLIPYVSKSESLKQQYFDQYVSLIAETNLFEPLKEYFNINKPELE